MGVKNDTTIIRLILGHWAGKLSEPEKKELDNWLEQSEKLFISDHKKRLSEPFTQPSFAGTLPELSET